MAGGASTLQSKGVPGLNFQQASVMEMDFADDAPQEKSYSLESPQSFEQDIQQTPRDSNMDTARGLIQNTPNVKPELVKEPNGLKDQKLFETDR